LRTLALASVIAALYPVPSLANCALEPSAKSSPENVGNEDFAAGCLPNGARYVIDRNPALPGSLLLSVNGGSDDELLGQSAAAHVIEHVGLAEYAGERTEYLRLLEARKILFLNGSTSYKSTDFAINLGPGFTAEDHETVAGLVRWWLTSIPISKSSIERERASVAAEGNSSWSLKPLFDIGRTLYGSRVGNGMERSYKEVGQLEPEAAEAFYRKWYRPDLATIVITGDVDVARWKAALASTVGTIPVSSAPNPRPNGRLLSSQFIQPVPGAPNRFLSVVADDAKELRVILASKRPALKADGEAAALRLALIREIVGEALNASAIDGSIVMQNSAFMASDADVEPLSLSAVLPVIEGQDYSPEISAKVEAGVARLRSLKDFGFTNGEIFKAKRRAAMSTAAVPIVSLLGYRDAALANHISRRLSDTERAKLIEAISPEEINSYLAATINVETDFDIAIAGPSSAKVETSLIEAARSGYALAMKYELARPVDRPFIKAFASPLAVPPAAREYRELDGNTAIFSLPGGQKIILKHIPSDAKNGGLALLASGQGMADAPATLKKAGIHNLSSSLSYTPPGVDGAAAKDFVEIEGLKFGIDIAPSGTVIRIRKTGGDMEALFQAARMALKRPTGEVPVIAYTDGIAMRYGANPKRAIVPDYAIVGDSLKKFDPQAIVVVGNFDLREARDLTMRYLGDLGPIAKRKRATAATMPIEALGEVYRTVEPREGGNVQVRQIFSAAYAASESSDAAVAILSKLVKDSIFETHRREGGYYAFATYENWASDSPRSPSVADISILYMVDNELVSKFDALTAKVVSDYADGRIDPLSFEAAKQAVLDEFGTPTDDPVAQARAVLKDFETGRSILEPIEDPAPAIRTIKLSDVQNMARLFFAKGSKPGTD
jgi:predicted Zn-dependent peptidase